MDQLEIKGLLCSFPLEGIKEKTTLRNADLVVCQVFHYQVFFSSEVS